MDNQRLSTLLAGTAQRDASAFSQLYQEFSPTVYGIALSVVKEPPHRCRRHPGGVPAAVDFAPRALPPGEPRRLAVHRHPPPGLGAPPAPAAPVLGGGPSPAGAFLPLGERLGLAVLPRAAGAPGRAVPANRHLEAGQRATPTGRLPPCSTRTPATVRWKYAKAIHGLRLFWADLLGALLLGFFGTAGAAAPSPHCGGPPARAAPAVSPRQPLRRGCPGRCFWQRRPSSWQGQFISAGSAGSVPGKKSENAPTKQASRSLSWIEKGKEALCMWKKNSGPVAGRLPAAGPRRLPKGPGPRPGLGRGGDGGAAPWNGSCTWWGRKPPPIPRKSRP